MWDHKGICNSEAAQWSFWFGGEVPEDLNYDQGTREWGVCEEL